MEESVLPWKVESKVMEVSVVGTKIAQIVPKELEWAREIDEYLNMEELSAENEEARRIKRRVARFT